MNDDAAFLAAIKANPQDRELRLVYADWLEDRGDARSEYLRIDGKLQEFIDSSDPGVRPLRARLRKIALALDADWVALIDALRPKFLRCRSCRKALAAKDAIDTNPRSHRRMKSSRYCKSCFEDAVRSQMHRGFDSSSRRRSAESDYHGGMSDDD